jgi:hypothetical protein
MRAKGVTAGARGGFTTAFSAVTIDRCEGFVIRAKGNRGSVAFLKGPSGVPAALGSSPFPGPSGL